MLNLKNLACLAKVVLLILNQPIINCSAYFTGTTLLRQEMDLWHFGLYSTSTEIQVRKFSYLKTGQRKL